MPRNVEQEQKPVPQVIEREVTLGLLNDKINQLTGMVFTLAKKLKVDLDEDEE